MLFGSPESHGAWRYRTRLLVGLLAVWVPVTLLVVFVLTQAAAQSVQQAVRMLLAERAEEVAWFVEDSIGEREADLEDLAIAVEPDGSILVVLEPSGLLARAQRLPLTG